MTVDSTNIERWDLEHYLGSQPYEDEVLLAFHEEVARRLRAEPEAVLASARKLLERWASLDDSTHAEHAYWRRWKDLLDLDDQERIARAIVEVSDEGRYIRQCSPFARSLGDEQRRAIRRDCEQRVRRRFGSTGR